jgi:Tfp pilus assembly protein PilP
MSRRMLLVVAASVLLAGCGGGISDLELYTEEVKSRPPGQVPPLPAIENPQLTPRQPGPDPFAPLH